MAACSYVHALVLACCGHMPVGQLIIGSRIIIQALGGLRSTMSGTIVFEGLIHSSLLLIRSSCRAMHNIFNIAISYATQKDHTHAHKQMSRACKKVRKPFLYPASFIHICVLRGFSFL
jgi:hypothetical protein